MVDKLNSTSSPYNSAIKGISNASKSISDISQKIASGESLNRGTIVEDAVSIKIDSLAIKANSKVINIVNETEQSVLDILSDKK